GAPSLEDISFGFDEDGNNGLAGLVAKLLGHCVRWSNDRHDMMGGYHGIPAQFELDPRPVVAMLNQSEHFDCGDQTVVDCPPAGGAGIREFHGPAWRHHKAIADFTARRKDA